MTEPVSPRFTLRRFHVIAVALALIIAALAIRVIEVSGMRDNTLPSGAPLGGDYVAFYAAANAAAVGDAALIYDATTFEALLQEHGPPRERYGLTWQYPPTYYFVVLPLVFFGFKAGYLFWSGLGAVGFLAAQRAFGLAPLYVLVIAAAPSTNHAFVTGQNGFLTAVLIGAAALFAKEKPIIAGLCAALLTVKPHLGLLIPIAFIAIGAWRAFAIAAAGAMALIAASLAAFGAEAWLAFFEGARAVSGNVAAGVMPLFKMASPFAALRLAGAPAELAVTGQILATLTAAVAAFVTWRRVQATELRAAVLIVLSLFAAPYSFYYEFVILALPLALLVRRAMASNWLPFEQALIATVFLAPLLFPGDGVRAGFSLEFAVAALAVFCVMRRIAHEAPEAFQVRQRRTPPAIGLANAAPGARSA
jgi:hypothetical protein